MLTSYELPRDGEIYTYEWEIKRSRFITWITRVQDEEQARDFIALAREEFPDARHHCSAYVFNVDGTNPVERSSDDGEPSGTAGKPMLDALKGSGLMDAAVVVIRYFGGIKLGAGGLVHAYSNSVVDALPVVKRVRRSLKDLVTVDLPHGEAGRIEADLRNLGIDVVGVDYGENATYTLAHDPGQREKLEAQLASVTQGQASAQDAGHAWVETQAS
ncbi:YigZ family protein [Corynebacterium breve]|uniref:YigZ family protein n=1 Tax=Corynebacterium breve TaxID=3049799 RepID=A0ABY8VCV2_9CORY|nr:YigZ family protein [Corynebacterium breve]WIM66947.1 YigZ family protein [Corynebacterium breve]